MTSLGRPVTAAACTPSDHRPWLPFYGAVPPALRYPGGSLSEAVLAAASRAPDAPAQTFFGATTTYRRFGEAIERCAAALTGLGLRAGDRITIAMLTSPQGVIAFCRQQLIKWICPRTVEFRRELPRTRLAKVDYRALAQEAAASPLREVV